MIGGKRCESRAVAIFMCAVPAVPVVLNMVIGPSWETLGDLGPPVSEFLVGFGKEALFLFRPRLLID